MKITIVENYEKMSALAADIFAEEIRKKPDLTLGLATGSTPLGLYRELIRMSQEGTIDFSRVRTYNLDEYYPIDPQSEQSYRYFMMKNLFSHIGIQQENIHIPYGMAEDPGAQCASYDRSIERAGGIDLQLLGVGVNGHIGFNEPDDCLYYGTHLVALQDSTIEANARFFRERDQVPTRALTMGVGHIMQAKQIVALISGANKRDVFESLVKGKITTRCPSTLLLLHGNAHVIVDQDAAN